MRENPEKTSIPDPDDDMFYIGDDNEALINSKKAAEKEQIANTQAQMSPGVSPASQRRAAAVSSPVQENSASHSPSPASQRRTAQSMQPTDAPTQKRTIPQQEQVQKPAVSPSPASQRRNAAPLAVSDAATVKSNIASKNPSGIPRPSDFKSVADKGVERKVSPAPARKVTASPASPSKQVSEAKHAQSSVKPTVRPRREESSPAEHPQSAAPYAARRNPQPQAPAQTILTKKSALPAQKSTEADKKPVQKPSAEKSAEKTSPEKKKDKKKGPSAQGGAEMMASIIKAIIYLVVVVVIATFISIFIIKIGNDVFAFVKEDIAVDVKIPDGATIDDITDVLYNSGIIKYPKIFRMYASLKHDEDGFIPGDYTVSPSMSYDELRNEFKEHIATGTSWITIPEGYSTDEIIDLMVSYGIGEREKYIDVINNYDFDFWFIDELEKNKTKSGRAYRLEGYLFPDTYEFYNASSEEMVIKKLLKRFDEVFVQDYKTKAAEMGFTVDEILTLASMIEKEAGGTADYMYVSSVFHNRLKNFEIPRLDSDATIVYGIQIETGVRPNTITHDDLEFDSPYNTYKNPGLPPSPITNPSASAIRYALYPATTEYYYFVTADNGKAFYAESKEEHAENIEEVNRLNASLAG